MEAGVLQELPEDAAAIIAPLPVRSRNSSDARRALCAQPCISAHEHQAGRPALREVLELPPPLVDRDFHFAFSICARGAQHVEVLV